MDARFLMLLFCLCATASNAAAESRTERWLIVSEDKKFEISMETPWTQHGGPIGGACPGESCSISGDPYVSFEFIPQVPSLEYAIKLIDTGTIKEPIGIGRWAEFDVSDISVLKYPAKLLSPTDSGNRWNLLLQLDVGTLFVGLLHSSDRLISDDQARGYLTSVALAFVSDPAALSKTNQLSEGAQAPPTDEIPYVPENLEDAVEYLKQNLSKEDLEYFKINEDSAIEAHMGFGMGLRNNWGLWAGSPLAKWFNQLGIYHPDDMSGIILTSFVRDLRGEPWELNEQVAEYKAYWAEEQNEK